MRIATPSALTLLESSNHPLTFTASHGERFMISVLQDDLIRVQHLPNGAMRMDRTWAIAGVDGDVPREGRRRDDLSPFACPNFDLEKTPTRLTLSTQQLHLTVDLQEARLNWANVENHTFAADLNGRAYAYDKSGKMIYHYMERREGEHYYGFGERSGSLDKARMRMRMVNLDSLGYNAETGDPLYKHWSFYITFVPDLNIAYGLFYDNLSTCLFDMGKEISAYHGAYRYYRAHDGDVDYYFIYGPTIEQVVEKFSKLIGRIILPPRWALGYLGSTMTYAEMPNAQEQHKRFVDLCRTHQIPCDAFNLSSGYTMGEDGKRYVFTWNRSRFPSPKDFAKYFHEAGIHLAANVKPCLLTTHPKYAEAKEKGLFVRAADSDEPEISMFWGGLGSYLDFTNPCAYDWWKEQVKESLLHYGIDSVWNDNNEYEIWDDDARCNGFNESIRIGLIRPLHSLLMTRASHDAQIEFAPTLRPYLITRSGSPGIQRYAQTWSGDNNTSWESLRFNIPMGLGMSLSGCPNIGHDVGGFYGYQPDPELFVRWVQNGIFHPRFTIHSWHLDGTVNEPWMYPDVLPIIREMIQFRYRLIPYLYSLLVEAARSGHPLIRPMVYHFAHDPKCYTESFDFMLGSHLLVASVIEAGQGQRAVYLPVNEMWCDFYSGEWHKGGKRIAVDAPLDRAPLLIRANGIIPMGKVMPSVGEQPDDLRQAFIFPHSERGSGSFTLVEDDGVTLAYKSGMQTEVKLEVAAEPDRVALRVSAHGQYPLPYHEIEFILPQSETRPTQVNSAHRSWVDEYGRRHVVVTIST
jgi:alpha-glucosidase